MVSRCCGRRRPLYREASADDLVDLIDKATRALTR